MKGQVAVIRQFRALAIFASAAVLVSTLNAQQVIKYQTELAPKYAEIAKLRKIGILPFHGPDGEEFTAVITGKLQADTLTEVPVFEVKNLNSINYEKSTTISKKEVSQAVATGQKLGVSVIFTGLVTQATVKAFPYAKTVTKCLRSSGLFKCEDSRETQVACNRVAGNYSAAPQAIRVADGVLIFTETVSTQAEYSTCEDGTSSTDSSIFDGLFSKKKPQSQANTPDQLLQSMREEVANQINRLVAPYAVTVEVKIKNKAAGLAKPDNVVFSNAVEFAKGSRMDRACSLFDQLKPANPQNADLLYNLGVCQEVLVPDDPRAAYAYYAQADSLLSKPDKLISEAYLRSKKLVENSGRVAKIDKRN